MALYQAGIDVNWRNEYGQTAVYLCCCYGHAALLCRLVSEWGADGTIADNSGVYPCEIAKAYGHRECESFLLPCIPSTSAQLHSCPYGCIRYDHTHHSHNTHTNSTAISTGSPQSVHILIDPTSSHPGAGSFYADGFIPHTLLQALVTMQKGVLVEAPPEKLSCSSRYYMCDSLGGVRQALDIALAGVRRCILEHHDELGVDRDCLRIPTQALPHMRFLEVSEYIIILVCICLL